MKIRKLRNEKGYSQEYMAKSLGMSQNNYSQIELGKINLTIERLDKIAELLETDVFNLLKKEQVVFNSNNNQAVGIASSMTINNPYADKLIASLETQIETLKKMLDEKDLRIKELEKKLL